jgi:hypothetical protein
MRVHRQQLRQLACVLRQNMSVTPSILAQSPPRKTETQRSQSSLRGFGHLRALRVLRVKNSTSVFIAARAGLHTTHHDPPFSDDEFQCRKGTADSKNRSLFLNMPTMCNRPKQSSAEVDATQKATREIIEQTTSEDYDGHTEFSRMTPAQRLAWLDQAVLFIQSRKQPPVTLQVAEEPPH